jgi:hypothetical protein
MAVYEKLLSAAVMGTGEIRVRADRQDASSSRR